MELLCPVCHQPLTRQEHSCRCPGGHSFDIARQGYVNLLPVQQKRSLHPGDTREQVLSRRAFLDAGFYAPIVEALTAAAKEFEAYGPVLDVGCGEGYYSARLAASLDAELTGVDISKEAVRCAAARYKQAQWLCASAARLPFPAASAGTVTSLFALTVPEEFHRCLKPGGLYFQVIAAEDHLLGLKSIIYPELHHKEKNILPDFPGFARLASIPIRFSFTVEGEQVQNLLAMTPHLYRVRREGLSRLENTPRLEDTASCILNVYRALPEGGTNS